MDDRLESISQERSIIVFIDIIDSSLYSSILGIKNYALIVLRFQELFEKLAKRYFSSDNFISYLSHGTEGDEGHLFIIIDHNADLSDYIFKVIKFVFEIKAYMKIVNIDNGNLENDYPFKEIKVASGIHYGDIAFVKKQSGNVIIGYNLNYAKRIETGSREGIYSQVLLSKEAYEYIEGYPIILEERRLSLKGISNNDKAYEVRSIFFNNVPEQKEESFDNFYFDNSNDTNIHREVWMKSYLLSYFYTKSSNCQNVFKDMYTEKVEQLLWGNLNEHDPIVLFARAIEYENRCEFTKEISYLKRVINDYPEFIQAKIRLVQACSKILNNKESCEEVFVRDTIEELLEKYDYILTTKERDTFKDILSLIKK